MGNESLGLLALPLPQLSLFVFVLSLSKGILAMGRERKGRAL
jgi:hypothetical protein